MKNKSSVIRLEAMDFYSYHGYFDEEQKIGNRFTVDVALHTNIDNAGKNDELGETVDYGQVYEVVSSVMKSPSKLLETIATDINSDVLQAFPTVQQVTSKVAKHNPPIGGVCEKASVELTSER
ncbi:MAG: dihydroneopterin aldolase [Bacteroidota bacterium]